ncbi:hypothetical protein AB0425_32310 [Actinosynnema sp. NPDC051121]
MVVLAIAGRQWDVKQPFTLSTVSLLHLNEDLHQATRQAGSAA